MLPAMKNVRFRLAAAFGLTLILQRLDTCFQNERGLVSGDLSATDFLDLAGVEGFAGGVIPKGLAKF
jgi:hypothetical protein